MTRPRHGKELFGLDALFPYSATTHDVTVRVSVTFIPERSDAGASRWTWAYHIRIENGGRQAVQLLSREWTIVDGRGLRQEVRGEGVVGEQPLIAPGAAFDYVSGCPLSTPSGWMEGSYAMVDDEGRSLTVAIPRFPLADPSRTAIRPASE